MPGTVAFRELSRVGQEPENVEDPIDLEFKPRHFLGDAMVGQLATRRDFRVCFKMDDSIEAHQFLVFKGQVAMIFAPHKIKERTEFFKSHAIW